MDFRDGYEGSSFCNSSLHIHGACNLDTQKEALFYYSILSESEVWFGLKFYIPVNNYGHGKTVSSPDHTFS